MKFSVLLGSAVAVALTFTGCDPAQKPSSEAAPPPQPKLGLQAWTFRDLTLAETLQKAADLGIENLEVFAGQKLGGDLEGELRHTMSPEERDAVKKLASDKGVRIVSYGVVTGKDEAEWRQIFEFAKAMNLQWISTEPQPDALPLVASLAKEFGVKAALHNHPTPSVYADPDFALKTLEPYGPELGLCADTGHWARSGHDPVAALRRCMPRVIALHFKDLNEWTPGAHDVPWGTGVSDAAGLISVLRNAEFEGVALAEYEHRTPQLPEEVERSVMFFRTAVAAPLDKLVEGFVAPPGFSPEIAQGWADNRGEDSKRWGTPEPLFAPDLSNATFPEGAWTFQDGVLSAKGGAGDIWTNREYGDFLLSLEFRIGEKGNSGVFLRCADIVNWLHNAIEVQILQGDAENDKQVAGAIFDIKAPSNKMTIKPGEWHKLTILAQGPNIQVVLDGDEVTKIDLDEWKEAGKNPDGSPNKFEKAYKDMPRTGRIGLQDHGDPVEFRNLTILAF